MWRDQTSFAKRFSYGRDTVPGVSPFQPHVCEKYTNIQIQRHKNTYILCNYYIGETQFLNPVSNHNCIVAKSVKFFYPKN